MTIRLTPLDRFSLYSGLLGIVADVIALVLFGPRTPPGSCRFVVRTLDFWLTSQPNRDERRGRVGRPWY